MLHFPAAQFCRMRLFNLPQLMSQAADFTRDWGDWRVPAMAMTGRRVSAKRAAPPQGCDPDHRSGHRFTDPLNLWFGSQTPPRPLRNVSPCLQNTTHSSGLPMRSIAAAMNSVASSNSAGRWIRTLTLQTSKPFWQRISTCKRAQ